MRMIDEMPARRAFEKVDFIIGVPFHLKARSLPGRLTRANNILSLWNPIPVAELSVITSNRPIVKSGPKEGGHGIRPLLEFPEPADLFPLGMTVRSINGDSQPEGLVVACVREAAFRPAPTTWDRTRSVCARA